MSNQQQQPARPCPHCGSAFLIRREAEIKGALREAVECGNCGAVAARVAWRFRADQDEQKSGLPSGQSTAGVVRGLMDTEAALRNPVSLA